MAWPALARLNFPPRISWNDWGGRKGSWRPTSSVRRPKSACAPDSDLDLAILPAPGKTFTSRELLNLAADLTAVAGRPVDLGVLHTGSLVNAKEAVARGRLLFERDRGAAARFAALVLSMYADLRENSREILHAYTAAAA